MADQNKPAPNAPKQVAVTTPSAATPVETPAPTPPPSGPDPAKLLVAVTAERDQLARDLTKVKADAAEASKMHAAEVEILKRKIGEADDRTAAEKAKRVELQASGKGGLDPHRPWRRGQTA